MKVREVIRIKGWINGSGWSYSQVIDDNIIEVESIPVDFADFDTGFLSGFTHNETEDTKVTAAYYDVEDAEYESPLSEISAWASDLNPKNE